MRVAHRFGILFLLLLSCVSRAGAGETADLSPFAESLRVELGVPGLAIVAHDSNGPIAAGFAGVRASGHPEPIAPGDAFHVGSLTKSMTSTLIGTFVEEGSMGWDSTIAQLAPGLAEEIPEPARAITVAQLLTHRAGLRDDPQMTMLMWGLKGTQIEQRRQVAIAALRSDRNQNPGSPFAYSNLSYVVAGHLLEVMTGKPWEELIAERLFEPLGLASAGQGAPGDDPDVINQPRGHTQRDQGWRVIPPGPTGDNAPPMGPAGRVHMSAEHLAIYLAEHLRGLRGQDGLLRSGTIRHIHDDAASPGYALGWGVNGDGVDRKSMHSGSNTRWLAFQVVWPSRDLALVIAMNAAPGEAMRGDPIGVVLAELDRLGLIPVSEPVAEPVTEPVTDSAPESAAQTP